MTPGLRCLVAGSVACLAAGCAGPNRSTVPSRDAPVVLVLKQDVCPGYEFKVHSDGIVEYQADQTATQPGAGWLRLEPGVVAQLRAWRHAALKPIPFEHLKFDLVSCEAFGGRRAAVALDAGEGWLFLCREPRESGAEELLRVFGATDWVKTPQPCVTQ